MSYGGIVVRLGEILDLFFTDKTLDEIFNDESRQLGLQLNRPMKIAY